MTRQQEPIFQPKTKRMKHVLTKMAEILEKLVIKGDARHDEIKEDQQQICDIKFTFYGGRKPSISIKDFIFRIHKYADCSDSCFIIALMYLDRLILKAEEANIKVFANSYSIHRLFLVSMVLAIKNVEDKCFNNDHFARMGGIPLKELNRLELAYLMIIQCDCHASYSLYQKYLADICNWNEQVDEQAPAPAISYNPWISEEPAPMVVIGNPTVIEEPPVYEVSAITGNPPEYEEPEEPTASKGPAFPSRHDMKHSTRQQKQLQVIKRKKELISFSAPTICYAGVKRPHIQTIPSWTKKMRRSSTPVPMMVCV